MVKIDLCVETFIAWKCQEMIGFLKSTFFSSFSLSFNSDCTSSIKALTESILSGKESFDWKFLTFAPSAKMWWSTQEAQNFKCYCYFKDTRSKLLYNSSSILACLRECKKFLSRTNCNKKIQNREADKKTEACIFLTRFPSETICYINNPSFPQP